MTSSYQQVPEVPLSSGAAIPQVGFGLFKVDPKEARRVAEDAIEVGYRHLDTAAVYGNEKEVGAAVAASGIPREEFFITTKVWNDRQGSARTRDACLRSLEKLGLDAVDLYLVHWPAPPLGLYRETWRAVQMIHEDGLARSVGVSNFLIEHLDAVWEDGAPYPVINQIEVHPSNQERALQLSCTERGIVVEAYSPLARGRATGDERIARIAARYGKSIPQVILRWHLQEGRIVIPKTTSKERMAENLDLFDFALTQSEVAEFASFDRAERIGADPRTFTG